jgi:hypothetical protein
LRFVRHLPAGSWAVHATRMMRGKIQAPSPANGVESERGGARGARREKRPVEKRCFSHGVNKPRVGRRSKTHGGRCASRDHRQTAQQRATSDGQRAAGSGQRAASSERRATGDAQRATGNGQRAHLKRGVASTWLTNPVLGAVRRLTAEGALRATTVRQRSNGQRATGNGQRATSSGPRATGSGRRATSSGPRAHLKRGVASTGLTNPVLGAVRRLTAEGALRATIVRLRSNGRRATGDGQRATSSERRATSDGRRATGDEQRAAGNERRATGSLEKRCFSHGVNKPRVGRRSKTHGGRCASRDLRQTAQQWATRDGRRALREQRCYPHGVVQLRSPHLWFQVSPLLVARCPSLRPLTVVARSAPFAVSLRTAPNTGFVNPVRETPLFKGARCPPLVARRSMLVARRPSLVARRSSLVARCSLLAAAPSDGGRAKRTFRRESSNGAQHGVC